MIRTTLICIAFLSTLAATSARSQEIAFLRLIE